MREPFQAKESNTWSLGRIDITVGVGGVAGCVTHRLMELELDDVADEIPIKRQNMRYYKRVREFSISIMVYTYNITTMETPGVAGGVTHRLVELELKYEADKVIHGTEHV